VKTSGLKYPKFYNTRESLKFLERQAYWKRSLRIFVDKSMRVELKVELHVINVDDEDNKILECALADRADIMVSGDKHFLSLGKLKKTRILTPREFFDCLT
jgi:predicted nucleic acid-binding protein